MYVRDGLKEVESPISIWKDDRSSTESYAFYIQKLEE